jgi:MFS family permease
MNAINNLVKKRKKRSDNRKYLHVATIEGVPALFMFQLLGGPFLTGYLLYLGATSQQIGFVLAITTLVNVAQIFMAVMMQKIRNRKAMFVIFAGMHRLLWASTGLIPFLFPKEWWVAVFIVVYGIAHISNAAGGVVWTSIISDMVPAPIRGRYFGIRNTILGAVSSLSLFLGGQIMNQNPGASGFHILFTISGICAVLNIISFFFYPNPAFETSTESNPLRMIRKPLKDASFLRTILFLSLWLFLQSIPVPFFSYVMLKLLNVSYQWVSIIIMVHTAVMMMSYYVWGNLNSRFSTKTLLLWSLPIIAGSCVLFGALSVLPALLVLFAVHILLGIGLGGFNQMVFNYTIGDTPKSERPMYVATYSAITGFTAFLGPMFGGWLYKKMEGYPEWIQTYGISVGIGLLLLVLGVVVGRKILSEKG